MHVPGLVSMRPSVFRRKLPAVGDKLVWRGVEVECIGYTEGFARVLLQYSPAVYIECSIDDIVGERKEN